LVVIARVFGVVLLLDKSFLQWRVCHRLVELEQDVRKPFVQDNHSIFGVDGDVNTGCLSRLGELGEKLDFGQELPQVGDAMWLEGYARECAVVAMGKLAL
jgi:hypothetical protein